MDNSEVKLSIRAVFPNFFGLQHPYLERTIFFGTPRQFYQAIASILIHYLKAPWFVEAPWLGITVLDI